MASNKTQEVLVIYPGRFQPFHKGHKMVFDYLNSKYDNVFVATSDKVDPPRSPFSFEEKKKMMELTGMDTTNVVMTKSPYVAMEITQNFDKENTILMFAISEKDMAEDPRFTFKPKKDGSPSYFQAAPKDGSDLETMDKHGYMITVPTFNFNVMGQPMKSATEVRASFAGMDDETKKKLITDLFGNYSDEVFDLMTGKITEAGGLEGHVQYTGLRGAHKQVGNHPHRVITGLDGEIRQATDTLEDLLIKVQQSPVGTKVRNNFLIQFHGAVNALKQQMAINLELREAYGLDNLKSADVLTLRRKQETYNLSITESNITVLETGKTIPVRNLRKLYERGFRKIEETKQMTSQKLGVFAKGRARISVWESNGKIIMIDRRTRRLVETGGSVKEAVNTLYNRGYRFEAIERSALQNSAGLTVGIAQDTVKGVTKFTNPSDGSEHEVNTTQAQGIIDNLKAQGYKAVAVGGGKAAPKRDVWDPLRDAGAGADSGLSLEPKTAQQGGNDQGAGHYMNLNAERDVDWEDEANELMAARGQRPIAQRRIQSRRLR